jgi:hypothetical protein
VIDLYNNIHAIKADIRQRYPSTAVSSLYIQLTYIDTPSLVVSSVATFPWQNEDERSEIETLIRRAQTAEGRQILAQVRVRNGYSLSEQSVIMRTFPLLLPLPPNWLQD